MMENRGAPEKKVRKTIYTTQSMHSRVLRWRTWRQVVETDGLFGGFWGIQW